MSSVSGRAVDELLDAVLDNRFDDGRLPPETELAQLLNVSRTTIRHALQTLEQAGLISRARRRGTFVRRHGGADALGLTGLIGFARLLRRRGHKVSSDITWETRPCPTDLAAALGWEPDTEIYAVRTLLRTDGEPAILIADSFPTTALKRPLRERSRIPDSLIDLSALSFVDPIDHGSATLVPMVADEEMAAALDIALGTPLLTMEETHYTTDGAPIASSYIAIKDAKVRLRVFRQAAVRS